MAAITRSDNSPKMVKKHIPKLKRWDFLKNLLEKNMGIFKLQDLFSKIKMNDISLSYFQRSTLGWKLVT